MSTIAVTDREHKATAYQLLGILQSYAPTRTEQARLTDIHNSDYPSDQARARALAGMLHDGLAYGNWPWTPQP